jgi:hypothetical protein
MMDYGVCRAWENSVAATTVQLLPNRSGYLRGQPEYVRECAAAVLPRFVGEAEIAFRGEAR